VEQNPGALEQEPAAKQSEDVAPVNSQGAIKPVETLSVAKPVEPKRREPAISGCRHFRTYDAASRTFTDYGGQRRSCR
jgi:hypothetical protein